MQRMLEAQLSQFSQFIKKVMVQMAEIKGKNYLDKPKRKGKMTNVPLGDTGHQSSGKKLSKDGLIYKNRLLDTDLTSQTATRRKLKGV